MINMTTSHKILSKIYASPDYLKQRGFDTADQNLYYLLDRDINQKQQYDHPLQKYFGDVGLNSIMSVVDQQEDMVLLLDQVVSE